MSLSALCLWCGLLWLVQAENDTVLESCPSDLRYADTNRTINITESCNEKPCIAECCPGNQTLFWNQGTGDLSCNDTANLILTYSVIDLDEYPELEFYNKNIELEIVKSSTNIKQFIRVYSDNFLFTNSCTNVYNLEDFNPTKLHYILENGNLVIRRKNYLHQRWLELSPGQFCVEHQVVLSEDGNVSTELVIRFIIKEYSGDDASQKNTLSAYGFLVSCVFLVLVLAVYALLPELRNLAGLILMAYVATLTAAFISRAVQVLSADNNQLLDPDSCVAVGFIQYYTFLASFTWMNVMSFDIWWTMRGFRKLRQLHRRGVLVKLGWYGLYGWGAPLLPVIFMVVVENIDMTHLPNFVTPHYSDAYCFMEEGERLLYMNGPILIATCVNITLFLMTAYNIWRIKRGVSQHRAGDSRRNKNDETRVQYFLEQYLRTDESTEPRAAGLLFLVIIRSYLTNRFGIYLKLSLVMGTNWILEVVGSVYKTDSPWWHAPDAFNTLVGLFIFIIFVCKTKVIVLLCKRFSIGNELVLKLQPDSTRTESVPLSDKKSRNSRY